MSQWKLKGCNRCGGDLVVDHDVDGWFEQCLQCSHRRELIVLPKYQNKQYMGKHTSHRD